jgi:hypothetical protein
MRPTLPLASALSLAMTLAMVPTQVLACGACFAPQPNVPTDKIQVLQQAERILFTRDDKTKKSVVWVEIKYDGPATGFAWVVPVPKKPVVGVGTSYLFDRLDLGTAPRFEVELGASENCNSPVSATSGGVGCGSASSIAGSSGVFAPKSESADQTNSVGVKVLEHDQIGPYDYEIIHGTDGQALFDWLNLHKYALPDAAKPIVESHVKKGDLFVAVRLQSGATVQEIKPISLTMDDAEPCVPLRLTSIAAVEDTTVLAYLAGTGRAVPKNYLHVQLNPMRINWFDGGSNYGQALSAAIDEAAGHAFATEFSGLVPKTVTVPAAQPFRAPVQEPLIDYTRLDTKLFAAATDACGVTAVLRGQGFPVTSETVAILEKHTGLAAASGRADLPKFYQELANGQNACDHNHVVDGKALAAQLDKEFSQPLRDVTPLLTGGQTFTRLVMRISPKEMTKDPVFAFNPALPTVANEHKAVVSSVCRKGDLTADAQRLTVIGAGSYVVDNAVSGAQPNTFRQPATPATSVTDVRWKTAPAALVVEVLDEGGPARPIAKDQIDLVDSAIAGAHVGTPSLPADLTLKPAEVRWTAPASDPPFTSVSRQSDPGGCTSGQGGKGPIGLGILLAGVLLGVAGARRRRT